MLPDWSVYHSVGTCCPCQCRVSPGVASWQWGRRRPCHSSRTGTASHRCAPAGGALGCQMWWKFFRTICRSNAPPPCAFYGAGWAGWSVDSSSHKSNRCMASGGWKVTQYSISIWESVRAHWPSVLEENTVQVNCSHVNHLWVFSWALQAAGSENALWQSRQLKGFSPVWIRMCLLKLPVWVNFFPQSWKRRKYYGQCRLY